MRVFILILLTALLGLLIFLKLEFNEAAKTANDVKQEYFTQEYTIIDIDENGYYGKDIDGKSIFFKKELISEHRKLKMDDIVIVYFEKNQRRDGIVKVEKK